MSYPFPPLSPLSLSISLALCLSLSVQISGSYRSRSSGAVEPHWSLLLSWLAAVELSDMPSLFRRAHRVARPSKTKIHTKKETYRLKKSVVSSLVSSAASSDWTTTPFLLNRDFNINKCINLSISNFEQKLTAARSELHLSQRELRGRLCFFIILTVRRENVWKAGITNCCSVTPFSYHFPGDLSNDFCCKLDQNILM